MTAAADPRDANRAETRLATRLAFLVAGFGIACWAPLVPFAKQRLGVDDGVLGLLLLCLGVGSVAAMLATGAASARHGSRPVIIGAGFALAALLPLLALASSPWALAFALLVFGAALGSLDVAMNVHAVEVERASPRPLMSGFHAMFSVGGLAGAGLVTGLLSLGYGPLAAALLCAAPMGLAVAVAAPFLLQGAPGAAGAAGAAGGPAFVRPRGAVLLMAALAAVTFLVEGAVLDWSALLLTAEGLVGTAQGGIGYLLFSVAMTAGRLGGDALSSRIGDRATLAGGGVLAVGGFVLLLAAPVGAVAMAGFVAIGLGAANLVPVLFRRAGAQRTMPAGLAIAAITTAGYGGLLVGPALVGFVAHGLGLPAAFWGLALLLCAVPLAARRVTRPLAA